jgi:hypothetical protein
MFVKIIAALVMSVLIATQAVASTTPEDDFIPEPSNCASKFTLKTDALTRQTEVFRGYVTIASELIYEQRRLTPKKYELLTEMFDEYYSTVHSIAEEIITSAADITDEASYYPDCKYIAEWAQDMGAHIQKILDSADR